MMLPWLIILLHVKMSSSGGRGGITDGCEEEEERMKSFEWNYDKTKTSLRIIFTLLGGNSGSHKINHPWKAAWRNFRSSRCFQDVWELPWPGSKQLSGHMINVWQQEDTKVTNHKMNKVIIQRHDSAALSAVYSSGTQSLTSHWLE